MQLQDSLSTPMKLQAIKWLSASDDRKDAVVISNCISLIACRFFSCRRLYVCKTVHSHVNDCFEQASSIKPATIGKRCHQVYRHHLYGSTLYHCSSGLRLKAVLIQQEPQLKPMPELLAARTQASAS